MTRIRALTLFSGFVLVAICGGLASQTEGETPVVLKVEPPNWWVRHSINPVRLMIRGRNLLGARMESSSRELKAGPTTVNAAGTYIFVDVTVAQSAVAGKYPLRVAGQRGSTDITFELLNPLDPSGRFQGFSPDDLIYLIMPDRFADGDQSNDDPPISRGLFDRSRNHYYHGGDLQGIIDHLPYLKDLGITAIWINPVYDNANRLNERETYGGQPVTDYHGYGAVDFYGVEEHFGDMHKFRQLVETAHHMGIKVIQDQVANHTGPYHPWVKDPPTPTWFNGTAANHLENLWQTWTLMDPHASPELQKGTLEGWFVNILPDLNQNDDETARYLIQNTTWWVSSTGLDGIRQDTLPYVPRRFWSRWMAASKKEFPRLRVLGELADADPALVSFFQGGRTGFDGVDTGVDSLFDYPLYYAVRRTFAQGKSIREIATLLSHDFLYPAPEFLVTFAGLHDVPRFMNEPGATVEGLRLAFTFLLTARGIPMIYYGDEIGMPGGEDPDNRRDFPGGWRDDSRNAFETSGRTEIEQGIVEHLRKLALLRKGLPSLRRGRMVDLAVGDQTYAYARVTESETTVVVLNNGPAEQDLHFSSVPARLKDGTVLHDRLGTVRETTVRGGLVEVKIPPRSGAILCP